MTDDIPWGDPPEPRLLLNEPRRCTHHRRDRIIAADGSRSCRRCGHVFDPERVRRGRNNDARGDSIERAVCRDLGLTPRGRYGDPVDGGADTDPYLAQVKSGGYFKPQQQTILDAMDGQRRGRPAILVTVETPGPGRRSRRLVTLTYEDWKWLVDSSPLRTATGSGTPRASIATGRPPAKPG